MIENLCMKGDGFVDSLPRSSSDDVPNITSSKNNTCVLANKFHYLAVDLN